METKLKQVSKKILQRLPNQGKSLKSALLKLRMQREVLASDLYRRVGLSQLPSPYHVYWVDPRRIEYHTNLTNPSHDWEDWVFDQSKSVARVQDGDWDKLVNKVSDMRVFRAVEERIRHGTSWESTDFYNDAIRQIECGRVLYECTNRASFTKRCENIDRLIESISSSGYLQGEILSGHVQPTISPGGYREILVNISRDGKCLFQDGRHRLAIARSLNIEKIPVQILVRHSAWQSFRELMWRMALGSGGASRKGSLYQAPMHFDLEDIPFDHACEDRWAAIRDNVVQGNRQVALDIGCNLGFLCNRLEAHGYSCVGVEYLPEIAFAAQKIARAEGKRMTVISGDILAPETLAEIGTREFALVIALNIFHHFLKAEEQFNRLRGFLQRVRTDTMIFEPHLPDEPQMANAFFNPSPAEFVRLIQQWSRLQHAAPIFTAGDGRTIYKLTR